MKENVLTRANPVCWNMCWRERRARMCLKPQCYALCKWHDNLENFQWIQAHSKRAKNNIFIKMLLKCNSWPTRIPELYMCTFVGNSFSDEQLPMFAYLYSTYNVGTHCLYHKRVCIGYMVEATTSWTMVCNIKSCFQHVGYRLLKTVLYHLDF